MGMGKLPSHQRALPIKIIRMVMPVKEYCSLCKTDILAIFSEAPLQCNRLHAIPARLCCKTTSHAVQFDLAVQGLQGKPPTRIDHAAKAPLLSQLQCCTATDLGQALHETVPPPHAGARVEDAMGGQDRGLLQTKEPSDLH